MKEPNQKQRTNKMRYKSNLAAASARLVLLRLQTWVVLWTEQRSDTFRPVLLCIYTTILHFLDFPRQILAR